MVANVLVIAFILAVLALPVRVFWMWLQSRSPPRLDPRRPVHEMEVDGVTCCIMKVTDGGQCITVYGWRDDRPWQEGDGLRLLRRETNIETMQTVWRPSTYLITRVKNYWDPNDMYFIDGVYVGDKL